MYRKLIFISVILLFDSESDSQIGFAVIAASASGIVYTIFRPMKDKFEDRLQTFVLWVIFFNVFLGAVYSRPALNEGHGDNNSLFVNVMFLILNCAVLVVAVGKSSDQNFFFDQYIVTALQKTLGVWSELFNYFFRK